MFRVVMRNCDPFEMTFTDVTAHSRHQLAGQSLHIHSITEFGGDDELPHLFVPGILPTAKLGRDIDRLTLVIESHCLRIDLVSGTLACDVASVGSPLASYLVSRIGYANGTTLVVGSRAMIAPRRFPGRAAPRLPCHACVPHNPLEECGPDWVFVPRLRNRRLSRPEPELPLVVIPHGSPDHAGRSGSHRPLPGRPI